MKIHIVARKIKLTEPIKDFIESKLLKLQEYIANIIWAQAIITVEKKLHIAEIIVHAGRQTMKASASDKDLYSAMDKVMDKIEIQIRKYKEKFKEYDINEVKSFKEIVSVVGPEIKFSIIKNVPVRPMSKEEAVLEMERLGYNFWLFMNKTSGQVQVVFKRLDSTYGLLQPVKS